MKYLGIAILLFSFACQSATQEEAGNSTTDSTAVETEAKWTNVSSKNDPTARHENAFTEVDGKFYLVGGRGDRPVDIYDPQTQEWSQGKNPPLEMNHFQAVSYDGKLYVMGALTGGFPDEKPIPNIYIYDPETDEWTEGPEIPEGRRRGAAGAFAYNDKLYLVNGIQNGHTDGYVSWLDEYDPATNTWTSLADAPHQRDHVQAVVADNKIYVAGGRTTSNATGQTLELTVPEVDVYDFASGEWSTLENDIPTMRAGTTSVVLGDKVIVIGGESGAMEAAHHQVEALDINTGEWESLPSLNRGRHGTQAIVYDDKIYIAAGSGNRGGGPELTSMEVYE
ncbi:Kelch repeat-containing protein [Catalinimonas niigatensis]|uniref:Kelch repeat-containing protein n=1 Tax=Catalinimonas niigatensis TaxID=1397264 RepID=UPI0026666772|nr:kelch repeat-containing protein [Catalinimonas niigatensis]WPP51258.1 kelch repeat-containing protein [Catalinimonas niigatensis]